MTVFKNFIKLAFKNKTYILIYLSIFLLLTMINTNNTKNPTDFKESKTTGRVINKSTSEVSKKLEEYINNKIVQSPFITEENVEEKMYQGACNFLLVIPEDFESNFKNGSKALKIYYDNTNPSSIFLNLQIGKYLDYLDKTKLNDGSYDFKKVEEALDIKAKVSFLNEEYRISKSNSFIKFVLIFMAYPLMAVIFTSIGLVVAEFNKNSLSSRNKILPIKATSYNLEMFLGEIVVGILITVLFTLALVLLGVFKKGNNLNILAIAQVVLASTVSIVAFTLLITSISSNKYFLNIVGNVYSLFLSFISGIMVQQEILSKNVVNIAKLFSPYYYVKGITSAFNGESVTPYVLYLLAFTIFYFILSQVLSKFKSGELQYR